jgi:hypothetical protein
MALPSSWHVRAATRNPNLTDPPQGAPVEAPIDRWQDDRTGDNIAVQAVGEIRGDPRSADNVAEFQRSFSLDSMTDVTMAPHPADVHGYPAEAFTISARYQGRPVVMVATVIQTGDQVFAVLIGSQSLARALVVQSQMLPTFAPV